MLISSPTMTPRSQPGTGMRVTPIRKPMAKRLKNAPSIAVPLFGCCMGIISATSTAPKIRPARIPKRSGFTAVRLLDARPFDLAQKLMRAKQPMTTLRAGRSGILIHPAAIVRHAAANREFNVAVATGDITAKAHDKGARITHCSSHLQSRVVPTCWDAALPPASLQDEKQDSCRAQDRRRSALHLYNRIGHCQARDAISHDRICIVQS